MFYCYFDSILVQHEEVREVKMIGHIGWSLNECRIWLKAVPSFDDEIELYDSNLFFPKCSGIIRSVAYNVIRQQDVEGWMIKTCKGQYSFELYSKSFWCRQNDFSELLPKMKNLAKSIGKEMRSGIEG